MNISTQVAVSLSMAFAGHPAWKEAVNEVSPRNITVDSDDDEYDIYVAKEDYYKSFLRCTAELSESSEVVEVVKAVSNGGIATDAELLEIASLAKRAFPDASRNDCLNMGRAILREGISCYHKLMDQSRWKDEV